MKMKKTLLVLLLLAGNATALIESSTQELTPGITNFTVIVDCGECEVEILKEVESKYKSTKTSSQTSEKVTETQSSSNEASVTDSNSITDSIKSADEEEMDSCGCVYKDEEGAESPKRTCYGFEEIIPKVLESTSVGNTSSSEFAKSLTSGNETVFKKTTENPVEESGVEDYSFYEDIPFVVLGPSKKKGTGRFDFTVYVSGVEGAYWIPVKVDGKTEYVGVLVERLAVNKTEVQVEEEPEGKASYLPFIILLCIGALLFAVWYFKFRGNSPEFIEKLKEKLKSRGGDGR